MTTVTGQGDSLSPAEFEAIRDAVMETPRGRWFLAEYGRRQRAAETATVLDNLKRLEDAVSSNHDALMRRLGEALANDIPHAATVAPQPELAPRHMKYFKQDEEIFVPAPQAQIAAVVSPPKPEAPRPEVPKGARLTIHRAPDAAAEEEAAPAEVEPPSSEASPAEPSAAEMETPPPELAKSETPAPASQHPAESAMRRIVIIRHKPGEDIDVPMQDNLAEAS